MVALAERAYESEDLLQRLLAKYPELMPGDQVDSESPRRWMLVTREIGVPDEIDAANRWSLDHLFVDQDGVPTLVEVKRSTDSRIRREVVGQLLDYAANAVVHWPIEAIRAAFERRCEKDGKDPSLETQAFLGLDVDPESFWMGVKTNLQAGKIRMLFVSDVIPPELRRVVEFLNEQMDPAEVLAIEIRQFTDGDLSTLVPKVFGQTAQAAQKKSAGQVLPRTVEDERTLFEALAKRSSELEQRVARTLLDWAKQNLPRVVFRVSPKISSFNAYLIQGHTRSRLFSVSTNYTRASVEVPFSEYMKATPFDRVDLRQELARRLNAIEGVRVPEVAEKRPNIWLSDLADGDRVKRFLDVIKWAVDEMKSAS